MKKNHLIIIAVIVLLLAGIGFAFTKNGKVEQASISEEEPVACTMEAIMCPDGSSVGRTGPICEFSACANMPSFSGHLVQQGEGFFLKMKAPDGAGGQMDYLMPLKFSRVSNVLSEFVDKNVTVKGAFSAGNTLEVDTIDAIEDLAEKKANLRGDIKVGETRNVSGVSLKVNKIVEDSRCPINAMCIQAGKLVANVTVNYGTGTETLDMAYDAKTGPYIVGDHQISIISAEPSRKTGENIEPEDYRLTFKVTKTEVVR